MAGIATIAAPVQAVAGQVDAQRQAATVQVGIQANVGITDVDIGTRLAGRTKTVDHAILDRLGAEAGVSNLVTATMKVHRNAGTGRQMALPVDGGGGIVQGIRRFDAFRPRQTQDDPVGQARPQTGPVGTLEIALGVHACHGGLARCQAECD